MPRLLIGAAHTLEQPGQIYQDLNEAELTRKLLEKCIPHLDATNIEYKTVPLDLPLMDRIAWIKDCGFSSHDEDIFVELHINDGGKRGIEGWYQGSSSTTNKSQKLTEFIVTTLSKKTGYKNQGAKSEFDNELGSLPILNMNTLIPTSLELLYIDNKEDIEILKDEDKLDQLCKKLIETIEEYIQNTPKVEKEQDNKDDEEAINEPFFNSFNQFGFTKELPKKNSSKQNLLMNRDDRKKIITDIYTLIFDQDIPQFELNRLLNRGMNKEETFAEFINSEEYQKFKKKAKDLDGLQETLRKNEKELLETRARNNDIEQLHSKLEELLHQKNIFIAELQNSLVEKGFLEEGSYYTVRDKNLNTTSESKIYSRKKSLLERILKIFGY